MIGGGSVLTTNLAQILESAGATDSLVPTCVSMFSVGNLMGRLLCMSVSNKLVQAGEPRSWFAAGIAFTMALSHACFLATLTIAKDGSVLLVHIFRHAYSLNSQSSPALL